ncbi:MULTISPECIES: hypothetical protein [unclassified Anoxybacillus]|jgi:hypothetical protein|uniref:hypothetical protein n=1 Tax=unclassified Anoxybacillus TaxID=2639704 RepID=UPI000A792234|nr:MULTISPECIES: hypothetical protein [unclassified Anoxybacillus]
MTGIACTLPENPAFMSKHNPLTAAIVARRIRNRLGRFITSHPLFLLSFLAWLLTIRIVKKKRENQVKKEGRKENFLLTVDKRSHPESHTAIVRIPYRSRALKTI